VLLDGTVVELDADTVLAIDYTPWRRRITLERGQAQFRVAPGWRPFSVRAGDGTVRDIGTTFNVWEECGEVRVAVQQGEVEIDLDAAVPRRLLAGQQPLPGRRRRRAARPGLPGRRTTAGCSVATAGRGMTAISTGPRAPLGCRSLAGRLGSAACATHDRAACSGPWRSRCRCASRKRWTRRCCVGAENIFRPVSGCAPLLRLIRKRAIALARKTRQPGKIMHRPLRLALLLAALHAGGALAQAKSIDIAAQDLSGALTALASQGGIQLLFSTDELKGARSAAVRGAAGAEEALQRLLDGSAFTFVRSGPGSYVIRRRPPAGQSAAVLPEVVVTSAAERGYKADKVAVAGKIPLSPREIPNSVSVLTREQMDDERYGLGRDVRGPALGISTTSTGPVHAGAG
jgi:hypothetical protein